MKNKVIAPTSLPTRLPVFPALTAWLFMDYVDAHDFVRGGVAFLFIVWFVGALYAITTAEYADVRGFGKRSED